MPCAAYGRDIRRQTSARPRARPSGGPSTSPSGGRSPRSSSCAGRPRSTRAATSLWSASACGSTAASSSSWSGPTGCGKSTLIKLLIRELEPTEGEVLIAGRDIATLSAKQIPYLRRRIGTVFQDFKLLPSRNVYDNVAYALQVIGALARRDPLARCPTPCAWSASPTSSTAIPTSSPAASSSASRSRAPSSTTRRCCWPTSRPETSTRRPRSGSCRRSTGSTAPAPPSSSSPTTARWWTRCAAA